MTALINTLVGAASTAMDRLRGTGPKDDGGKREFASVLASVSDRASSAARLAGRKENRQTSATAEGSTSVDDASDQGADSLAAIATLSGATTTTAAADTAAATAEDMAVTGLDAEAGESAAIDGEAVTDLAGETAGTIGTTGTTPTNVHAVNRDLNTLVPEFKERLDRVIDRMEEEFGHKVTVVEAHRSQERQDFLYEQGRTRAGAVVTWTHNSNHTQGRAADVMIDGSYNSARGYERLAQIAAQEGLRTLGAKDPGHLELPKGVAGGGLPQLANLGISAASTPASAVGAAQVPELARVATVAEVAQVARVAEVARPAEPMRFTQPTVSSAAADAAALFATRGGSSSYSGGGSSSGKQSNSDSQLASALELMAGDSGLGRTFNSSLIAEPQLAGGTDAVQRAAQILAMKDSAAASPINHILLRLDNAGGGEDSIRVDLRGSTVGTTLNIDNAGEAERLAARIGELRQSLGNHGLEAEAVRIRTTATIAERADLPRAALAGPDIETARSGNSRTGSDNPQGRDDWKESEGQSRRDPNDQRNRSRKEPPQEEKTS